MQPVFLLCQYFAIILAKHCNVWQNVHYTPQLVLHMKSNAGFRLACCSGLHRYAA